MKKRAFALLLAAVMCLSVFAACKPAEPTPSAGGADSSEPSVTEEKLNFNKEGYPISNEGMDFDIYALKWPVHTTPYAEMEVFKAHEGRTNVHINWTEMPLEGVKEKKNLVFANKDGLPDAFFGQIYQNDEILNYATQGLIIPLNDLIDKYGPNIKAAMEENPAFKKAMTAPDGNIYALAGSANPTSDPRSVQSKMFISKDWLDKLGAEVPNTVDELYEVLKKMKDSDLNGNGQKDEIPFAIEPGRIVAAMGPWGVNGAYNVKDGKVTSGYMEPGFRDAVRWFNKLYTEGLMDVETFTQTWGQMVGKGSGPELRYGFFLRTACEQVVGMKNAASYVPVAPLEGPAGRHAVSDDTIAIIANKFVITANCKDPGALIRWVDYFYTPQGSLEISSGMEGIGYKKNDDGMLERLPQTKDSKGLMPGGTAPSYNSPKYVKPDENIAKNMKLVEEFYLPYAVKEYFPHALFYLPEEAEVRAEYLPPVTSYTEEALARFITGDLDINSDKDYNNFLKELKNTGIEELLKCEQSAYDRFAAAK